MGGICAALLYDVVYAAGLHSISRTIRLRRFAYVRNSPVSLWFLVSVSARSRTRCAPRLDLSFEGSRMTKHTGVYVCEEGLHKVCTSSHPATPAPATHVCVCLRVNLCRSLRHVGCVKVCVCLTLCVLLRAETTDGQRGYAAYNSNNSRYCMSLTRYSQLPLSKDW